MNDKELLQQCYDKLALIYNADVPLVQALKERLAQPEPKTCWCETCRPITLDDMRMVLCPTCGNKRCPHATDHRNECTGSNDPGQPGSSYGGLAQPEPPCKTGSQCIGGKCERCAEPEPVAWMEDSIELYVSDKPSHTYTIPLYPAPPRKEWVGLTAKDLVEIPASCYEGAIWADQKLKEKNGG